MNTAALQRDLFMPRAPGGMGRGLMLAIAAHVLLVIALAFSVNWHTAPSPVSAAAELWAAVPQTAAPRAVDVAPPVVTAPPPKPVVAPPPPKPVVRTEPATPPAPPVPRPDAKIATERAEREQAKRKAAERDEQDRKDKAALLKQHQQQQLQDKQQAQDAKLKKQKADAAEAADATRLAAQREANLKRILGQAGASGDATASGNAPQDAGPSASYQGRIKARIKPNVSFPDTVAGNPAVEIEVRLTPEGRIISPSRVVKSSGVKEWDDAVLRAIGKTEVLPKDESGRVPASMIIVYRPRD